MSPDPAWPEEGDRVHAIDEPADEGWAVVQVRRGRRVRVVWEYDGSSGWWPITEFERAAP